MSEMRSEAVAVAPPARNVVIYRNGDPFFHGRKLVVSQRRFQTFETFLNEVTSMIQAPLAVRGIYTPRQGHRVTELAELHNGCHYVAAGFERFKRLNYLKPGMKQLHEKQKKGSTPSYPVISRRANILERRRQVDPPCVIHVFRNGDLLSPPFRLSLQKNTLHQWNSVLDLLSEKANLNSGAVQKLCRMNGDIISCGKELVNGHYYVAVGMEKYKNLPYIQLLLPPKTVHRSLWSHTNNRIRHSGRKLGKPHLASQDGATDSVLFEMPKQLDLRRVQSTGVVGKDSGSSSSPAPREKARKCLQSEEKVQETIVHTKPVRVGQIYRNTYQSSDQEEGSVYKMKGTRQEMQDAQEIEEDEDTQVELPVDERAAEMVEEEAVLQTKPWQLNKKIVQKARQIQHGAGDLGDPPRQPSFPLAQRNPAKNEK